VIVALAYFIRHMENLGMSEVNSLYSKLQSFISPHPGTVQ